MKLEEQNIVATCKKKVDSGKTFCDNFVDNGQICMGFETDTLEKIRQHEHLMRISNKDLIE